jgi:hypothetical protein
MTLIGRLCKNANVPHFCAEPRTVRMVWESDRRRVALRGWTLFVPNHTHCAEQVEQARNRKQILTLKLSWTSGVKIWAHDHTARFQIWKISTCTPKSHLGTCSAELKYTCTNRFHALRSKERAQICRKHHAKEVCQTFFQ